MNHDDLRAVWETYVSTWKAETTVEKRALFAVCLAPTCVYTDPLTEAKGWDELLAYMESFHQQVPGGHFVTEYFVAHHERSIARWKMLGAEGQVLGEGTSYGEYDAQRRLLTMTGFFEVPETSSAA